MISVGGRTILLFFFFIFPVQFCLAQEEPTGVSLLKQQLESSKAPEESELLFIELLNIYAQDNKFNEFYNLLEGLEKNKKFRESPLIFYYKTLARFRQMQFLEENKMWQELFDNKDSYIADLDRSLAKAKKLNTSLNPLALRLRFLEAQIKKDDDQALINALEDLFNLASEYAQTNSDVEAIKDIADELSKEKEDNYARKLYSVYVSKISKTDISQEELETLAQDFLEKDKVDLAVSLYDVYLDRVTESQQGKNIILEQMFGIAEKFLHPGWQEGVDPFFAEKLYEKIESLYNVESFDESSQYERAYNLERIKEHEPCFLEYLKLVNRFPKYQDRDRIYFRLGILSAYEFNKVDEAEEYFLKVVNDFPKSVDFLNSLYHLGLLEHWRGEFKKAEEFYNRILESTKELEEKPGIVTMTESRLKEIEKNKDIEYNLRMFLKSVLEKKEETPYLKLELFANSAKDYLVKDIKFKTSSYFTDTGCLQQDFTYLWSGQLGSNQNPFNEFKFETNYKNTGTKVVNVVLIGPSGIVDGTVEMANVYVEGRE